MVEQFQIAQPFVYGEVVWAKVKGHPWWPGMVSKVYEKSLVANSQCHSDYEVSFLGEKSHSKLSKDKLAKFEQNFKRFASIKKSKLSASIQSARRIIQGISSLEQEYEILAQKNSQKNSKQFQKQTCFSSRQQSSESEFTNDKPQKKQKVNNDYQQQDCAYKVDAKLKSALQIFINGSIINEEEDNLLNELINYINSFLIECRDINIIGNKRNDAIIFAFKQQWGALLKKLLEKLMQKV